MAYPTFPGEREHDEALITALKSAPVTTEGSDHDGYILRMAHLIARITTTGGEITWWLDAGDKQQTAPSIPYAKKCCENALISKANDVIKQAKARIA
jgi:hypothetical protein